MITNQILQVDCVEGMRTLPDQCIPLTVTSPPYDELRDYDDDRNIWDFEKFMLVAKELWRLTAQGGVVVWVVADQIVGGSETCTSDRQKIFFQNLGFRVHHTMVMARLGSRWPSKVRYGEPLEYAFILSKGRPRTINLLRDKENKRAGEFQEFWRREPDGRKRPVGEARTITAVGVRRAIWNVKAGWNQSTTDGYAFDHSALMPEEVAGDHILSWSRPGEVVFDPFCGAGTTCKMAILTGRRYLGMEISDDYVAIARRRVRDARERFLAELP